MKPEVKLYRDLKKIHNIYIVDNRLENRSLSGTPDLLAYPSNGTFLHWN